MVVHMPALRDHLTAFEIPAQVYLMDWYDCARCLVAVSSLWH